MTAPPVTVAAVFLRLGLTSFGGPAAHVALMEEELVRRRGWLTHAEFADLLGAANLIPGPTSTELAIHVGGKLAGPAGLVLAGVGFIGPAAVIVGALAAAYVAYGRVPQLAGVLAGVKPLLIAVVAQAVWHLGRACLKSRGLAVLAVACAGLALAGAHELAVLFGAGFAWAAARPRAELPAVVVPLAAAGAAAPVPVGLWPLFGVFLKVGSVLFGSGYVLLAYLRADLVERHGWLTAAQLLDAVAVGQVTPGPVLTTATFIGYLLAGPAGAAVATAAIFLPAFVFVALSRPLLPRLRRSAAAGAFLDGVNAASLALMAVVTVELARAAVTGPLTAALAAGAAAALVRWRVNSAWLMAAGAAVGWAVL